MLYQKYSLFYIKSIQQGNVSSISINPSAQENIFSLEEKSEKKYSKLIWIIISIIVFLLVFGILAFFVLNKDRKTEPKQIQIIRCETNDNCEADYICEEEKCIRATQKISESQPSNKSSSSTRPRSSRGSSSQSSSGGETTNNFPDSNCQTNLDCFIEASASCSKHFVTHITTINLFGEEKTTTMHYELEGLESDKCVFYLKTQKTSVYNTVKS